MDELRIVGWTNFECEYPSRNVEGSEFGQIIQLVGKEVLMNGYCFSGQEHQNASTGVPVFSDGTCLRASMRAWGLIMATIYSIVDGIDLSYMDFYMDSPKEAVLPKFNILDIDPCTLDEERPGMIIEEDIELISSTISMGIELMTFDKVIKKYIEFIQKANEE